MGFDLQRFVGVRDGPNVRQSFDAVWADWEMSPWRLITFWSHPVQNVPDKPFDDFSSRGLQYRGFRIERNDVGPGKLSAYYSLEGMWQTGRVGSEEIRAWALGSTGGYTFRYGW
jgi:hypothetical protein